ncbi:MAG: MBL fold metallo-hydrolase, partial [Candidatus Aminicenantes bacterium]|nr:MBL fold metallo-hydrolase [Candidatus Aminicenantes bacterium]
MIEISFLGTGGAVATKERDNASFIIRQDKILILVDCPGSVIQKIKKLDFDPREIQSIFITHIHPDHIYGLPSFIHSLMLDDCIVDLYGSQESIQFCMELLDLFHLREERIKCRINFVLMEAGKKIQVRPSLKCLPLKVPHHSSSLAFKFYFEGEKKEIAYSGDTPLYSPFFKEIQESDCLIHDCSCPSRFFEKYPVLYSMHTHSMELGQASKDFGIKRLIPYHFFGELDFSLDEIEKELRESYKKNLIIPKDFSRIII